jgi:hypothetical protein
MMASLDAGKRNISELKKQNQVFRKYILIIFLTNLMFVNVFTHSHIVAPGYVTMGETSAVNKRATERAMGRSEAMQWSVR